jgi:hypothetical protein
MIELYAAIVHKVRKGLVRNTVLAQIKEIKRSISLLLQGQDIKTKEIKEYKGNPEKVKILKRQVEIIDESMGHLKQAVQALSRYRKLTTSE